MYTHLRFSSGGATFPLLSSVWTSLARRCGNVAQVYEELPSRMYNTLLWTCIVYSSSVYVGFDVCDALRVVLETNIIVIEERTR